MTQQYINIVIIGQKYDSPALQGSRKLYCVHKVAKGPNVDEECKKMLPDSSCRFYKGMNRLFAVQNSTLQVLAPLIS